MQVKEIGLMEQPIKKYSTGSAKAIQKSTKGGGYVWELSVNESTSTQVIDDDGNPILLANGKPKTSTKHRTLRKRLDLPCKKVGRSFSNVGKAKEALAEWRADLERIAAEERERAIEAEKSAELREQFSYDNMAVPNLISSYLDECELRGLEPSTVEGYHYASIYAARYFEGVKVKDVTTRALQEFAASLKSQGLGMTTRNKALKTLKAAWDSHADEISVNPFSSKSIQDWWPKSKKANPHPLSMRSFRKVMRDLDWAPADWFPTSVKLALYFGLREGEVCGLRWRDVDMSTGDVTVYQTIGRTKGGARTYTKAPKNTRRNGDNEEERATRNVPGSTDAIAFLQERFDFMLEEYLNANPDATLEDAKKAVSMMYVVGDIDGKYRNPTVLYRTWSGYAQMGITDENGKRATFHGLRDTFGSFDMTIGGDDPVTTSDKMGHSDPGFTMRVYGKTSAEHKRASQAKLTSVYAEIKEQDDMAV